MAAMTAALQDPNIFILAVVLLGALGLGTGFSLGKGGALLAKLRRNGESNVSVSVAPVQPLEKAGKNCSDCLQSLQSLLPCKEHSGIATSITFITETNKRIEGRVEDVWDAVGEMQKDVKALIKAGG